MSEGSKEEQVTSDVAGVVYLNGLISDKELFDLVNDRRVVSKFNCNTKDLGKWLRTIDMLNSLNRDESMLDDTPIKFYKVPTFFKKLVMPNSVTLTGVNREVDVLLRPTRPEGEYLSYSKFNDISMALSIAMTKKDDKIVEVKKEDVQIQDVYNKAVKGDYVCETGDAFFPIALNVQFLKDSLYCTSAKDKFKEAILEALRGADKQ